MHREGDWLVCAGGEWRRGLFGPQLIDTSLEGGKDISRESILDIAQVCKPVDETWLRDKLVNEPRVMELYEQAIEPNLERFRIKYGALPEEHLARFLSRYLSGKGIEAGYISDTVPCLGDRLRSHVAARIARRVDGLTVDETVHIAVNAGYLEGHPTFGISLYYGPLVKSDAACVTRIGKERVVALFNRAMESNKDLGLIRSRHGSTITYWPRDRWANPKFVLRNEWGADKGIVASFKGAGIKDDIQSRAVRALDDLLPLLDQLSED